MLGSAWKIAKGIALHTSHIKCFSQQVTNETAGIITRRITVAATTNK